MLNRQILFFFLVTAVWGSHAELSAQQQFRESTINWLSTVVQTESLGERQKPPVVTSVSLQPNGTLVAVVGDDHIVNLYDRESQSFQRQLIEHTDWVRTARFSPDGTKLATAGNDRRLVVWDIADTRRPRVVAEHPAAIVDVAWNVDGTKLATVGFENKIRVYDLVDNTRSRTWEASCADMRTIAFSPDGRFLAAGGRKGHVDLWDVSSETKQTLSLHSRRIRALTFSRFNQLISCGDDRAVKITDLKDTTNVKTLPDHGGKLFALCTLAENLLATAGSDNTIYVWNLNSLQQVGTLAGHTGTVTSLDWNNNTLASGSFDTRVRLWTTERMARGNDFDRFRR